MNETTETQSGASAVLNLRVPEDRARLIRKGYSTQDIVELYLQSEGIELLNVDWHERWDML